MFLAGREGLELPVGLDSPILVKSLYHGTAAGHDHSFKPLRDEYLFQKALQLHFNKLASNGLNFSVSLTLPQNMTGLALRCLECLLCYVMFCVLVA